MPSISIRGFALLTGLVITAAAVNLPAQAVAQTGPGWVSLFDGKEISSDWDRVGESNWRVEDGAIVADVHTGDLPAFLVTKQSYKDFQVYVEFWSSDDANSGVMLRCEDPRNITDRNSYEVNIFDQRPDPTYGTGGIVNFAEVSPAIKVGGKWNTYEITAKGRQITVTLNGKQTADLNNGLFIEGPLALQHGAGTLKFRKVAIKPL